MQAHNSTNTTEYETVAFPEDLYKQALAASVGPQLL